jgi:hypothetical protein
MKPLRLVLYVATLGLVGCGYDDRGTPDPDAAWWPWVCGDGGPAPESGCATEPRDSNPPDTAHNLGAGDDARCPSADGDPGSSGDVTACDSG